MCPQSIFAVNPNSHADKNLANIGGAPHTTNEARPYPSATQTGKARSSGVKAPGFSPVNKGTVFEGGFSPGIFLFLAMLLTHALTVI